MVIIMSKMDLFLYFFFDGKKSATVWTKYLNASGKFKLVLLENDINYWVLSYL